MEERRVFFCCEVTNWIDIKYRLVLVINKNEEGLAAEEIIYCYESVNYLPAL